MKQTLLFFLLLLFLPTAAFPHQAIGITSGGHSVNTLRYGSGAPSSSLGYDGDFYIDNTNWVIYGPRLNGQWPAGVAISSGGTGGAGISGAAINGSGHLVITLTTGSTIDAGALPSASIPSGSTGQFLQYPATGSVVAPHTLVAGDIPALNYAGTGACPGSQYVSAVTTGGVTCGTPAGTGGSGSGLNIPTFTGIPYFTNASATAAAATSSNVIGLFGSLTANQVFASPNGSSGAAAFRALVAGDIPALNYAAPGACPSGQYASATTTSGVTCSTPAGSGGSSAFGSLTSGVNTSANMIVGSGATMSASGSGAIVATGLASTVLTGTAGTKVASASAAGTSGDCVKWLSTGDLGDAGVPCGSGSGPAFSSLTSGHNTSAAMVVDSGSSLTATGSGSIVATSVPGSGISGANSIPTSVLPSTVVYSGSASGSGSKYASTTGAGTSGNCAKWDASGNVADAGAPCGSGSGGGISAPGTTTTGNIPQYSNTSGTALGAGLGVVTTLGSPGSNSNVATEAAVRAAISAGGGMPSPATGSAGYLQTNGTSPLWGDLIPGPSGALCAGTGCSGGTPGIIDIVTSVVPRMASANTMTGYNLFTYPIGMAKLSSGTIPATGNDNLYIDTGDNLHIVNPSGVDRSIGGGSSTVLQASTIVTEGDSITAGYEANGVSGATGTSYAALVSTDAKTTLVNHSVGGFFACDEAELEAIPGDLTTIDGNSMYTLMIGTNDANNHTTSDGYSTTFNLCHQAAMAWIAAPNKFAANNTNCTDTGTWSAWPGAGDGTPQLIGEYTTQSGATKSCPITTTGGPIYVWYWMQSPNSGAGTYAVDGGGAVAFTVAPAVAISAKSSSNKYGWGLIRIPVAAGSHTILFTNTTSGSGIVLSAIGTTSPAPMYQQPHLFVAGVIKQDGDANSAVTAYYDSLVKANVSLLAGDGLNITYVPVRNYLCTVVTGGHCYSNYATPVLDMNNFSGGTDILHPNAQGHLELKRAFEDAMQFTPYASGSGGGGSGTVNSATSGQFAYYSSTGTAVSGHTLSASDIGALGTLTNATSGNAATATELASTPTTCSTGQAPTGILPNGNATGCASTGSGSSTFATLGGGTNTSGAFVVGSGASLSATGTGSVTATAVLSGLTSAKPATCTAGSLYFATDATAGQNIYECASANTWTQQSGGSGGSVSDASLPSDQCVLQTPVTISYTSLTGAASATPTYTLTSLALPSTSTRICLVEITGTTQFAGTSITAGTVRLQSGAGTPVLYSPNQDILSAAVGPTTNNYWSDTGNTADRTNSSLVAAFTFTGGTSAALTAGAVKITVGFRTMP